MSVFYPRPNAILLHPPNRFCSRLKVLNMRVRMKEFHTSFGAVSSRSRPCVHYHRPSAKNSVQSTMQKNSFANPWKKEHKKLTKSFVMLKLQKSPLRLFAGPNCSYMSNQSEKGSETRERFSGSCHQRNRFPTRGGWEMMSIYGEMSMYEYI